MSLPRRFISVPRTLHLVGLSLEQYAVAVALLSFDHDDTRTCQVGRVELSRAARLPINKDGTARPECKRLKNVLDQLEGLGLVTVTLHPPANQTEETARFFTSRYDFGALIERCIALETSPQGLELLGSVEGVAQ